MTLVRQYPEVWTIPNLPGNPLILEDLPWLSETLLPGEIERMREQIERRAAGGPAGFGNFELQCRNLGRNHEAGMIIGMGTDSGTSVAWTAHTELRDMVMCGLSPMEAIVAATRVNAQILGLDQLGNGGSGKERRLRGAGREPSGRHHQHTPDLSGLPEGRRSRSRGAEGQVHGRRYVTDAPRHHLARKMTRGERTHWKFSWIQGGNYDR